MLNKDLLFMWQTERTPSYKNIQTYDKAGTYSFRIPDFTYNVRVLVVGGGASGEAGKAHSGQTGGAGGRGGKGGGYYICYPQCQTCRNYYH